MDGWLKENLWIVFVVMTVLCWGAYVPMVHEGQAKLGGGNPKFGGFQAFVCISAAYLIIGLAVLFGTLSTKAETFSTSLSGYTFAIFGGILGALGAIGITLALKNGGTPLLVPPLVFAGAPIVNVLVSMAWHPGGQPKWYFYLGLVMAAVGAALVLGGKPSPQKPAAKTTTSTEAVSTH